MSVVVWYADLLHFNTQKKTFYAYTICWNFLVIHLNMVKLQSQDQTQGKIYKNTEKVLFC